MYVSHLEINISRCSNIVTLVAKTLKVVQNGKQIQEEVYDVAIDGNSSPDVIVVGISFDEIISVVYDETTHYQCTNPSNDHTPNWSKREKHL